MMKKVLLISNEVMHYRVSIYNYFYQEFKKIGWEFIVRSDRLQKNNPYQLSFDFKEIKFSFAEYKQEILQINPDVVIIFLHLKEFIIWPLIHWLKLKKIPIVFWTKGMNLDKPDDKMSVALYKYVHAVVDRMILYSEHEKKFIKSKYYSKITIANNTINYKDFPDIQQSKEEIRNEFNIPYKKIVLSVGRMGVAGGRKKIDHLIQIFDNFDNPDIGLVIVGSGVNKESVGKENKNITYLGEVYDDKNIKISKIFKMSDIFCIPGHVGLGLNQAMFWGLPVITEEGKQPPEIYYLKDNFNGFIVPEDDIKQLEIKIRYLLDNDDILIKFSKNAKKSIMKEASIENMYAGFKKSIESF